jgi:hypothetical protein
MRFVWVEVLRYFERAINVSPSLVQLHIRLRAIDFLVGFIEPFRETEVIRVTDLEFVRSVLQ